MVRRMKSLEKILVVLMAFVAVAFFGLEARAGSLGSRDETLGFWGHPYPYGYTGHEPSDECYRVETYDSPFGPRQRLINICRNRSHPPY